MVVASTETFWTADTKGTVELGPASAAKWSPTSITSAATQLRLSVPSREGVERDRGQDQDSCGKRAEGASWGAVHGQIECKARVVGGRVLKLRSLRAAGRFSRGCGSTLGVRPLAWWQFPRGLPVEVTGGHRGCDSAKNHLKGPAMTHHQSALSALIGELLADPEASRDEMFRRLLAAGLQDLIDAEADQVIGASRYERTPDRVTRRNGTRSKTVATTAGEVDLAIPKLRQGSFFPSLLSPRRRVDRALYAVESPPPGPGVSPPARSTNWSRPWGASRGSPSPRCRESAPTSTKPSAPS